MLLVVARVLERPVAVVAFVHVPLLLRLPVALVHPVRHGRLQDVGQVGVAAHLGHQGGGDAARLALVLQQVLLEVARVVVVAVANVAGVQGCRGV